MNQVLGIISIKGGVGKTTIAASLASNLANNYRKKVLLIDTNYSAPNLGLHMDILEPRKTIHHVLDRKMSMKSAIQRKYSVDVIPGDYVYNRELNYLKLKDRINSVQHDYDFIILDSSPSLNDEILSTILASDQLFVVTTPDYPTLSCSLKAARLAIQRGTPIAGIIVNKVRDPKFEISLDEIEEATEIPVVAKIPDDRMALRALFTRIPVSVYVRRNAFAREVNRLGAALSGSPEKRPPLRRIFPFHFQREEVNRQLLKESFYSSIFDYGKK